MGTFAEIMRFADEDARMAEIPESKTAEFQERIEKLFQAGGMMEANPVQLCGKKVTTIQKVKMHEDGINFYYNYFEDSRWENAGYNKKNNCVWSGKIGWGVFNTVVIAGYVLEELYSDGITAVLENGELVSSGAIVGWINYLFDERYHIKNFDPWRLFEAIHYSEEEKEEHYYWNGFGNKRCGLIGSCEIYAVLHETDSALEKFAERVDKDDIEYFSIECMKELKNTIELYKKNHMPDEEIPLKNLMEGIQHYYENGREEQKDENQEKSLKRVIDALNIADAPAFAVKAIAELYKKDFWDLWGGIKKIVKRKRPDLYGNEGYCVVPIPTEKMLGQSPDDMLYYWEEDSNLNFSEDLKAWIHTLKKEFDSYTETETVMERPLEYILEQMEYAEENYFRVYTFADFFEESLEHLGDKRYMALWRIYNKMLHDPEMEEAGSVIFVPNGPEHEREGLHYWGEQPKRRLRYNWDITEKDKRNNKARITLKRYMALTANKALRKRVFGF